MEYKKPIYFESRVLVLGGVVKAVNTPAFLNFKVISPSIFLRSFYVYYQ